MNVTVQTQANFSIILLVLFGPVFIVRAFAKDLGVGCFDPLGDFVDLSSHVLQGLLLVVDDVEDFGFGKTVVPVVVIPVFVVPVLTVPVAVIVVEPHAVVDFVAIVDFVPELICHGVQNSLNADDVVERSSALQSSELPVDF